jgi:MYXO-CTERM domain-containing protein
VRKKKNLPESPNLVKHQKMNMLRTTILAALASAALSGTSHAVLSYANGDLMLGFRISNDNTVNALYYDIGNISKYTTSGPAFDLSLSGATNGNILSDLTAAFGANPFSNANLAWAVFGNNGNALSKAELGTKAETIFGTQVTPSLSALTGTPAASTAFNTAQTLGSFFSGSAFNGNTGGTDSAGGLSQAGNVSGGWWSKMPTASYATTSMEGVFGSGSSTSQAVGSALDLFKFGTSGGTGTYQGTFSINDSGVVHFGLTPPTAAPEPSHAVLSLVGLAALGLRRRRRATVA